MTIEFVKKPTESRREKSRYEVVRDGIVIGEVWSATYTAERRPHPGARYVTRRWETSTVNWGWALAGERSDGRVIYQRRSDAVDTMLQVHEQQEKADG